MKNKLPSNSANDDSNGHELSRRDLLRGSAALLGASVIDSGVSNVLAHEAEAKSIEATSSDRSLQTQLQRPSVGPRPNILYFLVDNLGYGELGCYGGGKLQARVLPAEAVERSGTETSNSRFNKSYCRPQRGEGFRPTPFAYLGCGTRGKDIGGQCREREARAS